MGAVLQVRMARCLAVVGLGLASLLAAARAVGADAKLTTAGLHLGDGIAGPEIKADTMKGRVVLVEFWGIRCPPCATTMPMLERLHRSLGPQGVLVVGAHTGGGTAADIRAAASRLGISFPIVGQTGIDGLDPVPAMPYSVVFDHAGVCVFQGSTAQACAAATAALNAAPPLILDGRGLVKLASLQPSLRSDATFGTALKKARALVDSKDEATAEEAALVVEKLEAWGRTVIDTSAEARVADPAAAFATVQRCATAFRGEPLGKEALQLTLDWKKDPAFQAALKSGPWLAQLEAQRSQLLQGAAVVTPDIAASVPPNVRRMMKELADAVQQAAPGSSMAERAGEIAMEWNLGNAGP